MDNAMFNDDTTENSQDYMVVVCNTVDDMLSLVRLTHEAEMAQIKSMIEQNRVATFALQQQAHAFTRQMEASASKARENTDAIARIDANAACCVCMNSHKMLATICGHSVCEDCLSQIENCPLCRKPIVHAAYI